MTDDNLIQIDDRTTIPVSELKFLFSTSSGPGGQHANRSATRVTLLFDVSTSPSLGERARQRLLENLAHRLDKQGVLRIQVQDSRSQVQNRQIAISRLVALLSEALTEPKKRIKTEISQIAREKRLAEKKKQSRRKQERGANWSQES
ncbi:MAG: aminoacyl-tRNA hydrolase [Chloroflexi bacterium]|jgi:ribosome-associated protein|nr:aminoacyl-tRNA hydrolase [Chloroflexota bacterium]